MSVTVTSAYRPMPPTTQPAPRLSEQEYLNALQSLQMRYRAGAMSAGDFQSAVSTLQARMMAQQGGGSGGASPAMPAGESQMLAMMQAAQANQAAMAAAAMRLGLPPGSSLEQIQRAQAEQARARAMAGAGQTGPMTESSYLEMMRAAQANQARMAAAALELGLPPNASMEQIQRAQAERARAAAMGGGAETPREPTRSDFARVLNQLRQTNPRYARRLARQLNDIRRDNPGSTFAQNWAKLVSQISRHNPQAGLDLKTSMDRVVAQSPQSPAGSSSTLSELFAALQALYARIAALQQQM